MRKYLNDFAKKNMKNRISFLNGEFVEHRNAFVHIEERGLQLADGIYEVVAFVAGKLVDFEGHIERLFRSLEEFSIELSYEKKELEKVILELFSKNNLETGSIYIQVNRGVAGRVQIFPKNIEASIIMTVSLLLIPDELLDLKVISFTDIRWARCDIKSVALMGGVMAKQKAAEKGCDDAIFIKDGFVTEGSFSNCFIVDSEGVLVTREADNNILNGITRQRVLKIARKNGIKVSLRKFSLEELYAAKEVFLTSSTLLVRPVVKVDDIVISLGKIGCVTKKINRLYIEFINDIA